MTQKQSLYLSKEYNNFLQEIKKNIVRARNQALLAVNTELIKLYFNIGKNIIEKQKTSKWGDDLIGQIEKDLKKEIPNLKGFSRRNINYMRAFYVYFQDDKKMQQLVAQIPWGHICLILTKLKDKSESLFYIQKTIENNWSRTILDHQISLDLYHRQGKLQSNFDKTIALKGQKEIQNQFKKNYIFDFLDLSENGKEKDLENKLIQNIKSLIMELGKGFSFVGQQYKLVIDNKEFFIDLLFYNFILNRFVVVELKITEFKPEYIGQLNFYMTVVNKTIKSKQDKETIGLIICKNKNETIVEYALSNSTLPTGVAEYKFANELSNDLQKVLPDTQEIKNILNIKR